MSKKFLELAAFKILVLDEADEMLKVGNAYFNIVCPSCSLSQLLLGYSMPHAGIELYMHTKNCVSAQLAFRQHGRGF